MSTLEDFDRIALLDVDQFDHNVAYHDRLLAHIPHGIDAALDVGCGTGRFTRLLAARARRVHGVDLSPNMIRVARGRARHMANTHFEVADVTRWCWPVAAYDCVVSIATLHHVPLAPTLVQMRRALKPGGVLVVLDLVRGRLLSNLVAMPLSVLLRWHANRRLRPDPAARAAWAAHARHDHVPTLREVRDAFRNAVPEARIERHLFWRYCAVWHDRTRA